MSSPSTPPDAAARFVAWQRDYNGISDDRLRRITRALNDLGMIVGGPAEQATGADFSGWLESLAATGLHPNTVRQRGNVVRPFFRWAQREGLIDAARYMDLADVPNPRGATGESKPRPYTRKDVAKLWRELDAAWPASPSFVKRYVAGRSKYPRVWRHAMGLQINAIVHLCLHAGMRREEVFRAHLDDIHPDNAYVIVRGVKKGREGEEALREVPMTVELRRAVAAWLEFRALLGPTHERPWLVLHPKATPNAIAQCASHPLNPMGWTRFRVLLAELGSGWEYHRLRHTYATELLRAGMPIENLKNLLGHSRIQQTMAYTKIVPQDDERHLRRVEDVFTRALAREAA